ncbi:GyrI-like domain-containing protein [Candidatus Daviesbacteria bacterium]|nr:GyrI-like domain-containing protein [Candidatus Daviesbacteria bacterium]
MKILRTPKITKPEFLSEVIVKIRPEIKVVSLSGKGEPLEAFNHKISKVFTYLADKRVKTGHVLGIFYQDRRKVGVENETWDACVSVDKEIITNDEFKYLNLPEVKVASVILTGSYALIGQALSYLESVTQVNGIKTSWPLTEIYLEEGKEPVTELQYFVKE